VTLDAIKQLCADLARAVVAHTVTVHTPDGDWPGVLVYGKVYYFRPRDSDNKLCVWYYRTDGLWWDSCPLDSTEVMKVGYQVQDIHAALGRLPKLNR
jgi:hypothetical protein